RVGQQPVRPSLANKQLRAPNRLLPRAEVFNLELEVRRRGSRLSRRLADHGEYEDEAGGRWHRGVSREVRSVIKASSYPRVRESGKQRGWRFPVREADEGIRSL